MSKLKQKHIYITEPQNKRLELSKKLSGLSYSEICRRALDYYFNRFLSRQFLLSDETIHAKKEELEIVADSVTTTVDDGPE